MIDIDEIYDAAFDRSLFPRLLQRLVESLGAQTGFLAWADFESEAKFEVQFGNDPAYLQKYVETYWEHDILRPVLNAVPEGEPTTVYEHLQRPEVRDSVFYREYLQPQGIVDNLAVNLIKRKEMVAIIGILRLEPAPPFSADEVARLNALIPHLRRAVYLQSHMIRQSNLVGGYRQAAKGGRDGLVLLDDALKILDVVGDLETLTGLRVGETVGRNAFGRAVMDAMKGAAPQVAEVTSASGEPVRLLCHVQPIDRNPYGDLAAGPGVAHAVHVMLLDHAWPIALNLLASIYGLTPTEAKVLKDALDHSDISALDQRLGMAKATTRTHLHRIYDKTGTKGFADLCLFAHRFILPRDLGTVKAAG